MNWLLLGLDSLIAGIAVCAIVGPRQRLPLAALFGIADGVTFLIGAGLGLRLSGTMSEALEIAAIVVLGLNLLVLAASTRGGVVRGPLWLLPWALTLDNLTYGLAGGDSLLQQAGQQALSSSLLAFAGLMAAVVLPRAVPGLQHRAAATRFAGAALLVAAGGLALVG
jgi:hypothetical protein